MSDTYTAITDWEWIEEHRPEIRLHKTEYKGTPVLMAELLVGDKSLIDEIEKGDPEQLASVLEGWRDIFATAAEMAKGMEE